MFLFDCFLIIVSFKQIMKSKQKIDVDIGHLTYKKLKIQDQVKARSHLPLLIIQSPHAKDQIQPLNGMKKENPTKLKKEMSPRRIEKVEKIHENQKC